MKKILISLAVIVLVVLAALGVMWYMMGKPMYEPGMLRADKELMHSLMPIDSNNHSNYWTMESDIKLYHYFDGVGKNVLIIHGGPGHPITEPWSGLQQMNNEFRFVYYDQRGCGLSSRPFEKFSSSNYYDNMKSLNKRLGIIAQLADIERIRRILDEDKLIIIGHSYGALLASLYAAEFPERVKALVLVSPANLLVMPSDDDFFKNIQKKLPQEQQKEYEKFMDNYLDFKNVFKNSEKDLVARNNEFSKYFFQVFDESIQKKIKSIHSSKDEEKLTGGWMVTAQYFSLGTRHDYTESLKKVNAPVLIIHGEKDFLTEASSRKYQAFPNNKFYVIKDAGHFSYEEQPEEFFNVVHQFLLQNK